MTESLYNISGLKLNPFDRLGAELQALAAFAAWRGMLHPPGRLSDDPLEHLPFHPGAEPKRADRGGFCWGECRDWSEIQSGGRSAGWVPTQTGAKRGQRDLLFPPVELDRGYGHGSLRQWCRGNSKDLVPNHCAQLSKDLDAISELNEADVRCWVRAVDGTVDHARAVDLHVHSRLCNVFPL